MQYRIPWTVPSTHRKAHPNNATPIPEFILFLELRLRSRGGCYQNVPRDYWQAEHNCDARSSLLSWVKVPFIDVRNQEGTMEERLVLWLSRKARQFIARVRLLLW